MNELSTTQPAPFDTSTAGLVLDEGHMTRLFSLAEMMATGRATVPKHLQGNKGDCLAVCMQAMQWRMNPFAVAQKTHLVNCVLGYEAQLVIAVINQSGAIVGRLDWEWFGPWEKIVGRFKTVESKTRKDDDGNAKKFIVPDWKPEDEVGLGVIVRATLKGDTQPRELVLLLTQARTRNSTLWAEDPKQQIAYLAAKRWGRLHMPDVMLGVYTPDELETIPPKDMGAAVIVEDAPSLDEATLTAWRAAAEKGTAEARKFWSGLTPDKRGLASEEQKKTMWSAAVMADSRRTVEAPAATPAQPPAQVDDEFVRAMNAAEEGAQA